MPIQWLSLASKFAFVLVVSLCFLHHGKADEPDKSEKKSKVPLPVTKDVEEKLPEAIEKKAPEGLDDLKAIEKQVKTIFKKVMPATVCIQVGGGSGSGVVISEDGYILTAGHVSGTPNRNCTVIFPDGKRVKAKTLGYNQGIDSGLVKITDKGKYPFVPMSDSARLKPGVWCMTLGHPGGYRQGRTPVLRLGRVLRATNTEIQTDCALVGGDSGGPLVDLTGKVIGIHSRISFDITSNIHVPVNTYKDTWDDLVEGKEWGGRLGRRPQAILGLSFNPDSTDLKVIDVAKGGPADKAGLMIDDVVLSIDGTKLKTRSDLTGYLVKKKPGEEVKLEFERAGEKQTITLKLGTRTSS